MTCDPAPWRRLEIFSAAPRRAPAARASPAVKTQLCDGAFVPRTKWPFLVSSLAACNYTPGGELRAHIGGDDAWRWIRRGENDSIRLLVIPS